MAALSDLHGQRHVISRRVDNMRSLALALVALLSSIALGEVVLRVAGYEPSSDATDPEGGDPDWARADMVMAGPTVPAPGILTNPAAFP